VITVFLAAERGKQKVGRMVSNKGDVFFQYSPEFIATGLQLSPFYLPLGSGVFKAPASPFSKLHGVFSDSLPDGWGLLLMDRFLQQKGINVKNLTPMDRLLYIGSTGMGALTYEPDQSKVSSPDDIDLTALSNEATQVYAGKQEDILPALLKAGGSPGGARPKIVVAIKGDHLVSGEREIPDGYQAWIIKFHASQDKRGDEGLIEEAYARMLRLAAINMPETRLLMANDRYYFAVKRFDRIGNQRLHVHSLAGLAHADFRQPDFDYEKLLRLTLMLTKNQADSVQVYRQMIFNLLANNQDDHTKNFSFIMDVGGTWRLSPAYDVTFNQCHGGEQSMSIDGYGKDIPAHVFYRLGALCGLSGDDVAQVFSKTFEALSCWGAITKELGVSRKSRDEIQENFVALFARYRSMMHMPVARKT
jgi:serine/threonine-protein kinase HipA